MDRPATSIECTPIVIRTVMYVTTAQLKVQALSAVTGEALWTFDPFAGSDDDRPRGVSRGLTYWESGKDRRILFNFRAKLVALNADTGKPIPTFGEKGFVDLREGLDRDIGNLAYSVTTPGSIYKDLLILGSRTGEGPEPAAPGHVRAFDVRTGERRWIFHTIPHPGEFGYETWPPGAWKTAGGTNDWGGMSVDKERGLVFLALGSPTFDFYAGDRIGQNLFGNSVVALNADTGKRVWHYQAVHHDVWDYDLPSSPQLVTVHQQNRKVDAVAQVTKMGFLFLFDRETGKPLFPVEERPVPPSDVAGEKLWPTQPFPLKPPPFSLQRFTEADITDIAPSNHAYVLELFKRARSGSIYTPPSTQGTIVFPGFAGGGNWGGASFDPASGVLFVNSSNSPNLMTLADAPKGALYRYSHKGYTLLKDQEGYPAIKPPWGQMTAIDLNAGEIRWQVALGEFKKLTARGIRPTGTNGYGGSIVTAGGLVFIGATGDAKFRAFDARTGKVVWEAQLGAGGYATPCSYQINGRQYIVIAAGGGRFNDATGDAFVAYSLP
jgi:quinoprotein glucose dehydrogenase